MVLLDIGQVIYVVHTSILLAYLNSRSRSLWCLSVCRLSVMFVHLYTQPVEILAMFLRRMVPSPYFDIQGKFYEDRPREPSFGEGGGKRKRGSQI